MLCILLALLTSFPAFSQSPEADFKAGVAAIQKGDVKLARQEFIESLTADPDNVVTLYNLGLVEQKAGHLGLAIGLWRKALSHQPTFTPAQRALAFTKPRLVEIPHEVEFWETFRSAVLVPLPIEAFLAIAALLLLAAGWLVLRYFGLRQKAKTEELAFPSFPWLGALTTIAFLIVASLALAKSIDKTMIRGTIVEKKVTARSAPDASATYLFELNEGLEVIVEQRQSGWAQVTYPGASTGWIPATALLATDERATDKVAR